jgi:SAM-dependent methyltransferase
MGSRSIDYDRLGHGYGERRRQDPRIATQIHGALRGARTVVNVGAGTGNYEPNDRYVIAIEPSATLRAQRPPHLAPAIRARAEALPLDDGAVDAVLAVLTVHHWDEPITGLREMRRVARRSVVVVTFDIDRLARFWLITNYLPEVLADDRERFPSIQEIVTTLGGSTGVHTIPIPQDCRDGFFEAFYNRPERYLDPEVRAGQSAWPRLRPGLEEQAIGRLADDLASGAWDKRHGQLRQQPAYDGGLRLILASAGG